MSLSGSKIALSLDKLLLIDFLTTYGANFGLTSTNLHGDNPFYAGELAARRKQLQLAIKQLVVSSLIVPKQSKKGFVYLIHPDTQTLYQQFSSTYAKAYLKQSTLVHQFSENKTEAELLHYIQSYTSSQGELL
ncbi:ABC-three component system middle component 2 [Lactococcus lactis]|uniref:ABC-three component system middle component 2 n=1 Tax=Lactococcus lactis TaxID=1358 RepID=UPI002418878E|nr:ABC-three component system middle component 2 [Lactococcus lactis]